MTARPKVADFTSRHVTIDRVYAGIRANDRCTCGDLANDHEVKFSASTKRWKIRCVTPQCRCTTFWLAGAAIDQTTNQTTNQEDEHDAT